MNETLESDRTWLDGFRRGERDALARVFRAYVFDVTRTVRSARGRLPEHEVEAFVQEVFAKALQPKARSAYDGVRPFGAWLATIARNLVMDRLRREGRTVPLDGDVLDSFGAESQDPVDRLQDEQLQRVIAAFRATLDADDQAIYRVRFEETRSIVDAARTLGWSEIKLRRRDTRLRVRLLEALRVEGFLLDAKVRIGTSLLPRSKTGTG